MLLWNSFQHLSWDPHYMGLVPVGQWIIIIIIIIIITTTIFMVLSLWQSHCESSLGSYDEYRNGARWPPTFGLSQPTWAAGSPIHAASKRYPPLPFIIITQPETWYSFYGPMEGRRLSWPRWLLHTDRDGLTSHPSTNQTWHRVTSLMCQTTLPLC